MGKKKVRRKVVTARAVEPAPLVSAGVTREAARDDDAGWRSLTQSRRDLTPVTQARMQELAHFAWEQHRTANRLIELPIAFILGDGVRMEVKAEDARDWLRLWWTDPVNRMDLNLEKRLRELALFGEQLVPVFVNAHTGHVRHGAIDPSLIAEVIPDPDNAALPIGVTVAFDTGERRTYRVILGGDDQELLGPAAVALREEMTGGDAHFWRVNDLLTGRRGRSDLLSAIDLADAYSQLIFGEVERATALRMAVWDVTLKGATPEQVAARAQTITPPRPLDIRVHNEGEEWKAITPDLNAADASQTLRTVRNEILSGGTIPEHWYGGGGDVNRATAAEMDEPTYRIFRRRQLLWKAILEEEARHVIRRRLEAAGRPELATSADYDPCAVFPEMQSADVSRDAQALAQVTAAVVSLVDQGLITAETAVRIIAGLAARLGVEIKPEEELRKARAIKDSQEHDKEFRPVPDLPDPAPDPGEDPEENVDAVSPADPAA